MKLKYWTFIIALYAGSLCSCSDFLSEDPKGNITTNYSETEEGCERLVLSLYNTHRDFLERLYLFGSMGADEQLVAVNGNDWRYFGEYFDTQMINNGWNRDFWKQLYNSLNVANLATEIIETAEIKDEGRRAELRAEAHALRAFYFWIITETYGDDRKYCRCQNYWISTRRCYFLQANAGRSQHCRYRIEVATKQPMGTHE